MQLWIKFSWKIIIHRGRKGKGNGTNTQYLTYSASTAPGRQPEVEEEGLPGSLIQCKGLHNDGRSSGAKEILWGRKIQKICKWYNLLTSATGFRQRDGTNGMLKVAVGFFYLNNHYPEELHREVKQNQGRPSGRATFLPLVIAIKNLRSFVSVRNGMPLFSSATVLIIITICKRWLNMKNCCFHLFWWVGRLVMD